MNSLQNLNMYIEEGKVETEKFQIRIQASLNQFLNIKSLFDIFYRTEVEMHLRNGGESPCTDFL